MMNLKSHLLNTKYYILYTISYILFTKCLLCETNPISEMQNKHNNLPYKNLQEPVYPSPPKYKPNQSQFSEAMLSQVFKSPNVVIRDPPIFYPTPSRYDLKRNLQFNKLFDLLVVVWL
jgi:hypothetical protein